MHWRLSAQYQQFVIWHTNWKFLKLCNAISKFLNCMEHIHTPEATIPLWQAFTIITHAIVHQYNIDTNLIWVHCHEAISQSLHRDQRHDNSQRVLPRCTLVIPHLHHHHLCLSTSQEQLGRTSPCHSGALYVFLSPTVCQQVTCVQSHHTGLAHEW